MKILAFDTTAKAVCAAVCEDEKLLSSYFAELPGVHTTETLLPAIEIMLKNANLTIDDMELIAVSAGPGSFTGVRIGVATAKGLAFGKDIPCVEVSSVEALAENLSGLDGYIVPCIDARRGQVYTATFVSNGGEIKRLNEDRVMPVTELAHELCDVSADVYIVGDGYVSAHRVFEREGVQVKNTPPLLQKGSAASIGRVAYRKFKAGGAVSDRELSPKYLRMPQAERERLERLNKSEE